MMTSVAPQNYAAISPATPQAAEHPHISPGEIAIGVVIGRTSEYFDFFVYGIASVLVFPAVFFPDASRLHGVLYAFVIFALAFIARPIGTVLFMALQRSLGREAKLTTALFLLGASTAGIAFLPSYAHLGAASVVLLAIFRVCQGTALGGSWDGLPSLLALNAPSHRRGWYAMLGHLDWGWRYPFYVAFSINVVALFARLRLVSTPEYARLLDAHELQPTSVREVVRFQGRNVVIGALAALASYALFHLVTVFPLSWISLYTDQAVSDVLSMQMIGACIAIVGVIASGLISDKVGRRRTLGGLALLIAVFSSFAPVLLAGGWSGQSWFILIGFALLGLSYGQAAGAVTANFPAKYRYTGAALTSDLAWLAGAGFAPLVALGLSANFGLAYVGVYLLSGAVCTLAALSINRALEIRD